MAADVCWVSNGISGVPTATEQNLRASKTPITAKSDSGLEHLSSLNWNGAGGHILDVVGAGDSTSNSRTVRIGVRLGLGLNNLSGWSCNLDQLLGLNW